MERLLPLLLLKEDIIDDCVRIDVDDGGRGLGDARQGVHGLKHLIPQDLALTTIARVCHKLYPVGGM